MSQNITKIDVTGYRDLRIHVLMEFTNGQGFEYTFKNYEDAQRLTGHSFTWPFVDKYSYQSGIFIEDYSDIPNTSFYALIILLIMGIGIIIFGFLDKKYDFSILKFSLIRFILYILVLIPCTFIIVKCIVFPGAYVLASHYSDVASIGIQRWFFGDVFRIFYPVSYILIIPLLVIIMVIFTSIDIDLKRIKNEILKSEKINAR